MGELKKKKNILETTKEGYTGFSNQSTDFLCTYQAHCWGADTLQFNFKSLLLYFLITYQPGTS